MANTPPEPTQFQSAINNTWAWQWSELNARKSLRCVAAVAICLIIGLAIRQPEAALLSTIGAVSVGFGSFQRIARSRVSPMLFASVGVAFSVFIGCLVGASDISVVIVGSIWGFGVGILSSLSPGAVWIGTQCAVYLFVATHLAAGPKMALVSGVLILAGGLLQTVMITSYWRIRRLPADKYGVTQIPRHFRRLPATLRVLRRNLTFSSPAFRHALRMTVTMAVAAFISRALPFHRGYWVPMTALLMMQPDFHQTLTKALGRISGTLLGVALATIIAALLRPGPIDLSGLVLVFAWLSYTFLKVNYAAFAICITSYVVFLLSLAGLPPVAIIGPRVMDTFLGAAIALVSYAFRPFTVNPFAAKGRHFVD